MGCLKLSYYSPTLRVLEKNIFLEKVPLEKKGLRVKKRLNAYTYGFNGMEKDDEVKGAGNSIDYGARMYDSRIGRWLSMDAMTAKQPSWSPYKMAKDNPIIYKDPDGNTEYIVITYHNEQTGKTMQFKLENDKVIISKGIRTVWAQIQKAEFVDFKTNIDITIDMNGEKTIKRSQTIFDHQNSQDDDYVWYTYDGLTKGSKKYTRGHTKYSKEDYKITGAPKHLTSKKGEGTPFWTEEKGVPTINIDELVDLLDGVDILEFLGRAKEEVKARYIRKDNIAIGDTTLKTVERRNGDKIFYTEVKTSDSTSKTLKYGGDKKGDHPIQVD